jgi:hypothetical protein
MVVRSHSQIRLAKLGHDRAAWLSRTHPLHAALTSRAQPSAVLKAATTRMGCHSGPLTHLMSVDLPEPDGGRCPGIG